MPQSAAAKHTPAPWAVRPVINSPYTVDRKVIPTYAINATGVSLPAITEEGCSANCNVISAAPELLSALKELLPMAKDYLRAAPPDNGKIADAVDAIAKAEGR